MPFEMAQNLKGYSFCDSNIIDYLCKRNVCHDDEITLGSGSFSGISQQLPKRW